jgi:hypothetical protein
MCVREPFELSTGHEGESVSLPLSVSSGMHDVCARVRVPYVDTTSGSIGCIETEEIESDR